MIFLCDPSGLASLISWQSPQIQWTVNSILAAECLVAVEGAEACFDIRTLMYEMIYPRDAKGTISISILCDNHSLVDAAHLSTAVLNKRLQIEVGILRDDMPIGDSGVQTDSHQSPGRKLAH